MATYLATVVLTMPDNFDEQGATEAIEEALNKDPDIDNAEVMEVNEAS